jgi:twitching motility two-component system response regulator PilH
MSYALVVDDNRQTADCLCQMLSFLGMQVTPSYGPRAAILALKETTPSIIFLDLNLPGIDGFEIMAYLRREPRFANVPVVVVTSDDQPETALKAHRTGALLVLVKPATIDSLERVLRKTKLL